MVLTDEPTHRHTEGHGNSMTDPAQSPESVKIFMIVTTISFLVEGLAVWRISRNQFEPVWAETINIYSARKLEFLIPQNRYIGRQGGTWKIRAHLFLLREGPFKFEALFKHWEGLKLEVKLPFFSFSLLRRKIFFLGKTKFLWFFFLYKNIPVEYIWI